MIGPPIMSKIFLIACVIVISNCITAALSATDVSSTTKQFSTISSDNVELGDGSSSINSDHSSHFSDHGNMKHTESPKNITYMHDHSDHGHAAHGHHTGHSAHEHATSSSLSDRDKNQDTSHSIHSHHMDDHHMHDISDKTGSENKQATHGMNHDHHSHSNDHTTSIDSSDEKFTVNHNHHEESDHTKHSNHGSHPENNEHAHMDHNDGILHDQPINTAHSRDMDHSMHEDHDHGSHDHSSGDMSGHEGMDMHGNHSGSHGMQMWFYMAVDATVLFKEWKITNVGGMIGSMLGIVLLGMLYEGLKYFREYLFKQYVSSMQFSTVAVTGESGRVTQVHKIERHRMMSWAHFIQTCLHIIQVILSYFLMLIFMTYNVWLCLAVVMGAGFGYFIFGWKKATVVDITEHCH